MLVSAAASEGERPMPVTAARPQRVVAVIIPTLNEAAHIGDLLISLGRQATADVVEIIVADGGSTDATRAIVAENAARDPRIRLLDNPGRLQAAGVNRAARVARADVDTIIRADAHAHYPDDFVALLLDEQAASGAESVVNRLRSTGTSCFQRAVAAVSNSVFGTGGAAHRSGGKSGFTDHGHHALFDRAAFERIGGYDESFVANEDAEFDFRLRASGARIWFSDRLTIDYLPRSTLRGLARQYYRYGTGRARTRAKHGERLRLRQLIPPAMIVAVATGLGLAPLFPAALIVPAGYALMVATATAILVTRTRDACVVGALAALPAMHFAWGAGFIVATIRTQRR